MGRYRKWLANLKALEEREENEEAVRESEWVEWGVHTMIPTMRGYTGHGKRGKPALTETHFAAVETALKMDCTIDEACAIAWISRSAYYKHYRNNEEFKNRMDNAINYPKVLARAAVIRAIDKGDAKIALRYLNLRDKRFMGNGVQEVEEWTTTPVVQFISVAPNDRWTKDEKESWQTVTEQKSAWDTSVTILESNSEQNTVWENEAEILERLGW